MKNHLLLIVGLSFITVFGIAATKHIDDLGPCEVGERVVVVDSMTDEVEAYVVRLTKGLDMWTRMSGEDVITLTYQTDDIALTLRDAPKLKALAAFYDEDGERTLIKPHVVFGKSYDLYVCAVHWLLDPEDMELLNESERVKVRVTMPGSNERVQKVVPLDAWDEVEEWLDDDLAH